MRDYGLCHVMVSDEGLAPGYTTENDRRIRIEFLDGPLAGETTTTEMVLPEEEE